MLSKDLFSPIHDHPPTSPFERGLTYIYNHTVVRFFGRFYLAWKWKFADLPDICAALTGSPATFWSTHMEECNNRIQKDFTSYLVMMEALLYTMLLLYGCRRIFR